MVFGRPLRILVVEDEPLIAMVIEEAIETMGCEMVGPFAELSEAFKAAQAEEFDLAVLDINVRGGNCYPVADYLIERGYPLLLATGNVHKSFPANLSSVRRLEKPYSSAALADELWQLCELANLREASEYVCPD